MPPIFQQKIDETLNFEFPAWLDDIIVVTRGNIDTHEKEVERALTKLQNAGYRASGKKTILFQKETEWLGHVINENLIKPTTDKTEALTKTPPPKNQKQLKILI